MSDHFMDDAPNNPREGVTGWKRIGPILCAVIGGAIGILASPQVAIIPAPRTDVPADAIDVAVAITLLGGINLATGILARRKIQQTSLATTKSRLPLRRPIAKFANRFLVYQLVSLFVLFVYFNENSWTAATVGFTQEFPGADFAVGLFAYALLLIILALVFRLKGNAEAQADNTMTTMAALWPRQPSQKLAMTTAVCVINPIAEELIFRGILVYQLGLALGSFQLPIVLGLLVSLANHAYQGRRAILLHALYYVFAVVLLFSPMGLMGTIGMHFAGDIVPVALLKRNLKSYRERHRRSAKKVDETLPIPEIEA
jgi:membrane protease YdiL (CAAX protease family)